MSISTIVVRGFGSYGGVKYLPTLGFGSSAAQVQIGRLEYTIPRSRIEFTLHGKLDFTMPRSADEFTDSRP